LAHNREVAAATADYPLLVAPKAIAELEVVYMCRKFCRADQTLRVTQAMEAGIIGDV